MNLVCMWIGELVPLSATLFSFMYGLSKFFKKGKPLFLQSITMAMGCHALGSVYHLCQTLTTETVLEGFTPAYLGRIGFFLFLITASYGQMDRIIDDGSKRIKPYRYVALIAPILAALLYVPNAIIEELQIPTKIAALMVWLPAVVAVYYKLEGNLNSDTHLFADDIFLYYTRDARAGTPITSLGTSGSVANWSYGEGGRYIVKTVLNQHDEASDLNNNCGLQSDYIYLLVTRDREDGKATASMMGNGSVVILVACAVISVGAIAAVYTVQKKRRSSAVAGQNTSSR